MIEDRFPNGRPALEKAGVYMTDRDTVNKAEKMKVMTCLNPLHTALAVCGCLLGFNRISDEMKDDDLRALVYKLGEEGMPVVVSPGIINPEDFIREVLEERLPNPYIPDTPQRIATDTSQKVSIRFGETIKGYMLKDNCDKMEIIPFVRRGAGDDSQPGPDDGCAEICHGRNKSGKYGFRYVGNQLDHERRGSFRT